MEAAAGVSTLVGLTLFITYGAPDRPGGPNWERSGTRADPAAQPAEDDRALVPEGDELRLEADVCIVGPARAAA